MKNIFYIYVYLDPRKKGNYKYNGFEFSYEPFYVGKGKNNRYLDHLKEKESTTHNIHKVRKLNNIIDSGKKPIIKKIIEGLSEEESIKKEIELIKLIGKCKKGPLVNISDGGKGVSGYKHTKEDNDKNIKSRIIKVYQYDINLKFISEHKSISEASRKTGIKDSNIIKCCKGKILTISGFVFSYNKIINTNLYLEKIKNRKTISKKVYQYDLNFNLLKEHKSIRECLRFNNKYRINIYNNKTNVKEHLGFYFLYNKI